MSQVLLLFSLPSLKYWLEVINMAITDNQLKGNWGERYIAGNLSSQGCLVRHVIQGRDTGIDLYCETVKENKPFLHFWCQVKTSKEYKRESKQESFKSEEKHKEYWLAQPVPVFIFLVPDSRNKFDVPYYICRALDLKVEERINSFTKVELPEDLSTFLNERLALETFLWELKNGKVGHLKTPKEGYTKQFPTGVAHAFESELLQSLQWTLWRLSEDILFHGINRKEILEKPNLNDDEKERFERAKPYMEALEILIVKKKDKHYQNFRTIGIYYELEKEYEKSLEHYKKSKSCIEKDKKINISEDTWKNVIKEINQDIKRVESKRIASVSGNGA